MAKARRRKLLICCGALLFVLAALLVACIVLLSRSATVVDSDPMQLGHVEDDGFPFVDWSYWKAVNPDVVGWVSIPGTSISFPVVSASDKGNDYYLCHDVRGNWNPYGVPFLDAECEGLFDEVAVVYGHNMDDGSMFSPLVRYLNPSAFPSDGEVLVQTPSIKKHLKMLACSSVPWAGSKRLEFSDDEEFSDWLLDEFEHAQALKPDALLRADAGQYARVTILCTCSSSLFSQNRVLLYAG